MEKLEACLELPPNEMGALPERPELDFSDRRVSKAFFASHSNHASCLFVPPLPLFVFSHPPPQLATNELCIPRI